MRVLLLLVGAAALWLATGSTDDDDAPRCRLEQEWSAGDVYLNEILHLRRGGRGDWMQGDRHGEQDSVEFRWSKRGSTLTITVENTARDVGYRLEAHDENCVLELDDYPLPASSYRDFYGVQRH